MPITLPNAASEFIRDGRPTPPFNDLLRALVAAYNASPTTENLAAVTERLTALEAAGVDFRAHGINGLDIHGDGAGGWTFALTATTDNVPEGAANLYWTAPTGTGLVGITAGIKDAASVTVGPGLSLAAGVLSATGGGSGAWTTVPKPTSTIRSATITLANDPHLAFACTAGTTYRVRVEVNWQQANATMDMKLAIAYSAAFTEIWTRRRQAIPAALSGSDNEFTQIAAGIINTALAPVTSTAGMGYYLFDTTFTATDSGTFSVQWAQNTSDAGGLTLMAGSLVEYMAL